MFAGLHSPICLSCQYRSALKVRPSTATATWIPVRHAGGVVSTQRRTKPRMTLSSTVARTSVPRSRKTTRSSNSPFGGMNVTSVSPSKYTNQPSRMQKQRLERSLPAKSKKDEEPKGNDATFKALKMQRALSSIKYSKRNEIKDMIKDITTFDEMSLLPEIKTAIAMQALAGLKEITPTPIQSLAIPQILNPKRKRKESIGALDQYDQFLLAAETGSGKTLAYLAPVLDAVKRAEAVGAEKQARIEGEEGPQRTNNPFYAEAPQLTTGPNAASGRPRAIILLPSAELVTQVTSVLKLLSHTAKFRSAGISASVSPKVIQNRLFSQAGIDVLVTTPILLQSITKSDPYILSRVTHVVVDEADSLFDRSFAPVTSSIVDRCASSLKQLILCSATIPRALEGFLRNRFPDMKRLVTPNLHVIPRRVQLGVVDVVKEPYRGNKDLACADTLYSIGNSGNKKDQSGGPELVGVKRVLVFVNEREQTEILAEYLRSKGIDANALHRDTEQARHTDLLEQFTKAVPANSSDDSSESRFTEELPVRRIRPTASGRTLLNVKVLVTTDLGSRGIDTVNVRHVILYDVPHSTIDFIHRLGRTGRMKRRGRGIILVGKKDRRDVVSEVREGMFRGQALI